MPNKVSRALILCLMIGLSSFASAAERPNILIIMADDLGFGDVGFNGCEDIPTPNLDELAARGLVCTSAYVAHPVCGPSRAAIMTGRSPHTMGGQFNIPYFNHHLGVPLEETFLSNVLQKAGYHTGLLGKWHLGEGKPYQPNQRGFDEFYGHLGGGHKYFPEEYRPIYERRKATGDSKIPPNITPQLRNGEEAHETEYLTDAFSREAVDFIERASHGDQPFFLFLSYNAPHAPMEAKEEDLQKFAHITEKKRRVYAAMVHCMDYVIGRVVDSLKLTETYENTLIIFLSDNGGATNLGASNAPLRGGKRGVEEGGYRVPMFFHWAGVIPSCVFEHPVLTMDFYPTLAKLADATIPEGKVIDGKDVWDDLLAGHNPHDDELICAISHWNNSTGVGARLNDWKVVRSLWGDGQWRLINLTDDLSESNDLSKQNPERKEQLIHLAEQWAKTHEMPKWFYRRVDEVQWAKHANPYYDGTFSMEQKPATSTFNTPELKKGDATLEMFLAQEKKKAENKNRKWDPELAKDTFNQIDLNKDGIISGLEKNAYWSKK
ncbi:sulfatase-like hydrolase/transferase [Calycomorphotria hydatis]|uniref:Arylsulfatase n=1 Tax=Calycomorphotria hydatis TaxID=2528027 RepID=A0A517TD77_9PLAN|nr:sulfatase-like hydrolase/transferase [Calycomorphotria hydatis]QDT66326.1 Arylsulfatase [Calycomorphotria hydatis]